MNAFSKAPKILLTAAFLATVLTGCKKDDTTSPATTGDTTATDPAGPWSEVVWLDDAPGFDPSGVFTGRELTPARDDQ